MTFASAPAALRFWCRRFFSTRFTDLKTEKNGGFRADPLAKHHRFSFFVRFSFNGCRLTIAVCRYKMQASQISCAGAYRQYGTKHDCRIAPYFIGRNRRIVERKPSSLRFFANFCTLKYAMYHLCTSALTFASLVYRCLSALLRTEKDKAREDELPVKQGIVNAL